LAGEGGKPGLNTVPFYYIVENVSHSII